MCCFDKKDVVKGWPKRVLKKDAIIAYKTLRRWNGVWESTYANKQWHNRRMQAKAVTFHPNGQSGYGIFAYSSESAARCDILRDERLVKVRLYGEVWKFKGSRRNDIDPGYMATRAEIVEVK